MFNGRSSTNCSGRRRRRSWCSASTIRRTSTVTRPSGSWPRRRRSPFLRPPCCTTISPISHPYPRGRRNCSRRRSFPTSPSSGRRSIPTPMRGPDRTSPPGSCISTTRPSTWIVTRRKRRCGRRSPRSGDRARRIGSCSIASTTATTASTSGPSAISPGRTARAWSSPIFRSSRGDRARPTGIFSSDTARCSTTETSRGGRRCSRMVAPQPRRRHARQRPPRLDDRGHAPVGTREPLKRESFWKRWPRSGVIGARRVMRGGPSGDGSLPQSPRPPGKPGPSPRKADGGTLSASLTSSSLLSA